MPRYELYPKLIMKGNNMSQAAKIVTALKSGTTLSVKMASSRLGVSLRTVERTVQTLRASGCRIVTGSNTMGTRTYTMTKASKRA